MPAELALASSADFADRPNTLMPPLPIRRAEITVSVVARRYRNNTGLHVTAGQHYRLVALGTWVDLYIWRDAASPGRCRSARPRGLQVSCCGQ